MDGHVFAKAGIFNGSAVSAGQMVLQLSDRSVMWFEARIPEGTIGRIRLGQRADARWTHSRAVHSRAKWSLFTLILTR